MAAVLFGTAFYAFCVSGQVLGFGAGPAGVTRFARSTAPLGDLALAYVGPAMAAVLDIAAVLSALGAALVGVAVASRTLHWLATGSWPTVSHQTGTPAGAVTASMTLTFAPLLAFGLAGTGALRLYVLSGDKRRLPAAILPLGGAIAALYVLFRNLIPAPAFPCSLLPYLVGGWLVLGLAVAAAMPQLRRRVSEGLARS